MEDYLDQDGGWTTVTNQVAPLGAPDYSSYLLNIANSGAEVLLNINWGHDAVLSIQQAKQFGILDKMKLVVPYQIAVPRQARSAPRSCRACYAATDFWWTLEDKYPLAKMFVDAFEKKYGYKPEWGANNAYMEFALWADAVETRRHLLSAGRHQGLRGGQARSSRPSARCISAPPTTSWCARSSSCAARSRPT